MIGSGFMALGSILSGAAGGYAKGRQQNIENERQQGLLDLQRQAAELQAKKASADMYGSGLEFNPATGSPQYRQDFLQDDPNHPGQKLGGDQSSALLKAQGTGAYINRVEPVKFGVKGWKPGETVPEGALKSIVDLAYQGQADEEMNKLGGGQPQQGAQQSDPRGFQGPSSDEINQSAKRLSLSPDQVNGVRSLALPVNQASPGAGNIIQPAPSAPSILKFSDMTPQQFAKFSRNPYLKDMPGHLQGQEQLERQKLMDENTIKNQESHLNIAKQAEKRAETNASIRDQSDVIKGSNTLYSKRAQVGLKSRDILNKAINLAETNPEGAFAGIQGALAAVNSERGALGMLQFNVSKLPDFGGISQQFSDNLGSFTGLANGGGRLTDNNQRVLKDYLKTQLESTNDELKQNKEQATEYAGALNKPLVRGGRGLPQEEVKNIIAAPKFDNAKPKMNPQQIRIEREAAQKAIKSNKRDPEAVKRLFKQETGVDF